MPNYGDLALNLPPDWTRPEDPDSFNLAIVGHVAGKADAYRKDDEDARHQFAWVTPRYLDTISRYRSQGYAFCKSAEWEKNPLLWEWDAESFCIHEGQRLMARTEDRFLASMAKRADQRDKVMGTKRNEEDEMVQRLAKRLGIIVTEDDDVEVRQPRRGPGRPRSKNL